MYFQNRKFLPHFSQIDEINYIYRSHTMLFVKNGLPVGVGRSCISCTHFRSTTITILPNRFNHPNKPPNINLWSNNASKYLFEMTVKQIKPVTMRNLQWTNKSIISCVWQIYKQTSQQQHQPSPCAHRTPALPESVWSIVLLLPM